MVQGLASGSVGSWHEVPRTSLAPSSARLRLLRGRRPMGPRSPLRFGRRRADIPRMSCGLRSGRCRTDVPRTSCNPSSARLRLLRGRRPWFKVSPPARSARGMRSPGPHSVSAPLRSLQNRRPLDVLQPIFREATVVVEQVPMVPKSPLRSLQNRRPPDVLQPIFRKATVVVGQALYNDKTGKEIFL